HRPQFTILATPRTLRTWRTFRTSRTPLLIVALALLLNFWLLFPEARATLPLNDGVLHLGLTRAAAQTIGTNQSVLDHWDAAWVLGFPVFQYYQHVPHLVVAGMYRLLDGRVDLEALYDFTFYLVLGVFPLAVYAALRLLDFTPLAAAFAS